MVCEMSWYRLSDVLRLGIAFSWLWRICTQKTLASRLDC
jgi:hypothetical protein